MANKSGIISVKDQARIEARRRHRLSDAHVQTARELGLNPKKLAGIDNHHQEPWKVPLHQFIEQLYLERFGRDRPEHVVSLEEHARLAAQKRDARNTTKVPRAGAPVEDVGG
jgi:hypothetical protein